MSLCRGLSRQLATHYRCRNGVYPKSAGVSRFPVPDDKVSWSVPWPEYRPVDYTSRSLRNQYWADPDITSNFSPVWNALNGGGIDRRSHVGEYAIGDKNVPVNPIGRTGIAGRGCLGRWGPNHAADPIVTRWKRTSGNEIVRKSGKPVLQFVAIERVDCHEWAIPGGMVDANELVSATLKREFVEEALGYVATNPREELAWKATVDEFFRNGVEVYRGYVDDPRNTDNAWMETVATNFHDEDGTSVGSLKLTAGDDACNVRWMDVGLDLKLYANHASFIQLVATLRDAFWSRDD